MKKGKRIFALLLAIMLLISGAPAQTQAAGAKASVKKVTLNYSQYVLKKGKKLKLKAKLSPKSSKTKVTWKSSNEKVATVTSKA